MNFTQKTSDMLINPESIKTEDDLNKQFGKYKSFENYKTSILLKGKLNLIKITKYIIILYSEDSVLNIKPPMPIDERMVKALKLAEVPLKDNRPNDEIQRFVIDLEDRQIFEFIFEFLVRQKRFVWQEIVTLETQLLENQKLRMRPVAEEKGKDEMTAFEKKGKMTLLYKDWYTSLKAYYNEFYGDNVQVRAIHKINRENMALLENMAF